MWPSLMKGLESCVSIIKPSWQWQPLLLTFSYFLVNVVTAVGNPQSLGVVHELMHNCIVIFAHSLPLTTKELHHALTNPPAEEYLCIWDLESILYQLNERVGSRKGIIAYVKEHT